MKNAAKTLTLRDVYVGMHVVVSDGVDATIYTVEEIDRYSIELSYKLRNGQPCKTRQVDIAYLQKPTIEQLTRTAEEALRSQPEVPPSYEAARRCADWVMTAYTRAAPENGGDGTVSWDEIDYAHEAAREAFTDAEIEEYNTIAKEFNK